MGIVLGALLPHPPLLVPQVGGSDLAQVQKTKGAMETVARKVKEAEAEVVIIVSPHAPLFGDAFSLWELPQMVGDFARFGRPEVSHSYQIDLGLASRIAAKEKELVRLNQKQANTYGIPTKLDHGITVPLYYLYQAGVDLPILPLGMSMFPFPKLYSFGQAIREATGDLGRRAVFIASGDLSHRLTAGAPGGYHPQGEVFDRMLVDKLAKLDLEGLAQLDPGLMENAGQCGFNSLAIMLGAFDGLEAKANVLSYEGPFGVGYCTCLLTTTGKEDPTRKLTETLAGQYRKSLDFKRAEASSPVRLAIEAVEMFVQKGEVLAPENVPQELQKPAGAFVTIKKNGQLRGCIGTIASTKGTLAQEIIANAIAAAAQDSRFWPVEPHELPLLTYSVDVLGKPERVSSCQLDPKRFGVIVRSGRRQGLLLPDLEGVDTVAKQLEIAKSKAGISPNDSVELFRFQVVRYN
jgi:AmmeMemoRadiSam system protein A